MNRHHQVISLAASTLLGLAIAVTTADEPQETPKPTLVKPDRLIAPAVTAKRTFADLLQKGQTVTLYRLRQETPTPYQYQIRIVNDEQHKQLQEALERIRKQSEEYRSQELELESKLREASEPGKAAELRAAREQLSQNYRYISLPADVRSGEFFTISEVGDDYFGLEHNGVETFYRLSSVHRIIRGVEIPEE